MTVASPGPGHIEAERRAGPSDHRARLRTADAAGSSISRATSSSWWSAVALAVELVECGRAPRVLMARAWDGFDRLGPGTLATDASSTEWRHLRRRLDGSGSQGPDRRTRPKAPTGPVPATADNPRYVKLRWQPAPRLIRRTGLLRRTAAHLPPHDRPPRKRPTPTKGHRRTASGGDPMPGAMRAGRRRFGSHRGPTHLRVRSIACSSGRPCPHGAAKRRDGALPRRRAPTRLFVNERYCTPGQRRRAPSFARRSIGVDSAAAVGGAAAATARSARAAARAAATGAMTGARATAAGATAAARTAAAGLAAARTAAAGLAAAPPTAGPRRMAHRETRRAGVDPRGPRCAGRCHRRRRVGGGRVG